MQIETLPLIILIVAVVLVFLATLAIVTGRSPEVLSRWVMFRADRDTVAALQKNESKEERPRKFKESQATSDECSPGK